jgi:hypothetical protein
MAWHPPPPGFELIEDRKLTRHQRRAMKQAQKLDRKFFRQHPLRLTRVRRAIDGETELTAHFPGKKCFVVVRKIVPGAHHGLFAFADSNLDKVASSESVAAEIYDLMLGKLGGELQDWSTKAKQQALDGLLATAPMRGEA